MRLLIAAPDLRECWSARLLLSHAGHQIVGATTSAIAAAALARDATPDLCLFDAWLAADRTDGGLRMAEAVWTESGAPSLLLVDVDATAAVGAPGPETLARLARPFGALELLEAVQICDTLLRREPPPARVDRLTRLTLFDHEAALPQ